MIGCFANVLSRFDSHTYTGTLLFMPLIRQKNLGNWPNTLAKWLKTLANRKLVNQPWIFASNTISTLFFVRNLPWVFFDCAWDDWMSIVLLFILFKGTDWVSLYRCHHDAAEEGGVDSSSCTSCCGLFLDQRRLMDQLGGRFEGKSYPLLDSPMLFQQWADFKKAKKGDNLLSQLNYAWHNVHLGSAYGC